jgi:PAS domain S-box-containing protein
MADKSTCEELERKVARLEREGIRRQKAEKALKESEEKYRSLVEQASDAILILLHGKTIYRNPSWERLLGYSVEDTSGKSFLDLIHEEDRGRVKQYYEKRLKGESVPEQYEMRLKSRNGRLLVMEAKPHIIQFNGKPATMVVMRDLTERRRAEAALRESEERYRVLFESALVAIFTTSIVDGSALEANDAAVRLFGYSSREEFMREYVASRHYPDRHGRKRLLNELKEKGGGLKREGQFMRKDGAPIWIEFHAKIDQKRGWIETTAIDISERKKAENQLERYHNRLRTLASKLSLAEESERRRIANEVHDHIGQNLAFAKMKLAELQKSMSRDDAGDGLDAVKRLVDKAIQDTRALISDIGSPVLYEIGFVPAVESLTRQIQERHGIRMAFKDDGRPKPLGRDFEVLLYKAVRELLANMTKHSQATSGKVTTKSTGDQIRVDVQDDGVGFDMAQLGFKEDRGSGFGFFSIRERLEPLGGRIVTESEVGRGTRITLMAPLVRKNS